MVMFNAGALMVIESAALIEAELLSVTLMVKLEDPAVVGVPEIVPPERVRPAGSDPPATDHIYGGVPPVAVSACE